MNKKLLYIILCSLPLIYSCSKSPSNGPVIPWDGNVNGHAPVAVTKTSAKEIFAHYMPWFETPLTNNGFWGQHWTMANENPNIITNGQRQIASYYYPLTGPYATGDTTLIDYQLLLMKLSGIDGVFIDWPGTLNYSDYPQNVANTNAVISRLARVGLKYAIVYEDQNLQYVSGHSAQIAQAQADMSYIQTHYFKDTLTGVYEKYAGRPLLLDFGPYGPLNSATDWNTVFSTMSVAPSFFADEYRSSVGGTDAVGEFAWVEQTNISSLASFYGYTYSGAKAGAAYPGFNSFYTAGGWPNNTPWTLPYTLGSQTTFDSTLSYALHQPGNYIQLVTWNDYGEGTMIEPTTQYQYSYLTTLQQKLGVQNLSVSDLQAVYKLYNTRVNNNGVNYNPTNLEELDQVYYDMVSLKMDSAKGLLNNF